MMAKKQSVTIRIERVFKPALLPPHNRRGRVRDGLIPHFDGECQRERAAGEGPSFARKRNAHGVW